MKPTSTENAARFPGLLRWLRQTWLCRSAGRLVQRLRRGRRKVPPKPKSPPKQIEALEVRSQPDDMFAAGQVLVGGSALMSLAAAFPTPTQVLMHGWGAGQAGFDLAPSRPGDLLLSSRLSGDLDIPFFLSRDVLPPPEPVAEDAPLWAAYDPPDADPNVPPEQDPNRLVLAEELLRSPLAADVLAGVDALLQGPLPASNDQTGLHDDPAEAKLSGPDGGGGGNSGGGGGGGGGSASDPPALRNATGAAPGSSPTSLQGPSPQMVTAATTPVAASLQPTDLEAAASAGSKPAATADPSPVIAARYTGTAEPITATPTPRPAPPPPVLQPNFAAQPLAFSPNLGQSSDPGAAFVAQGQGYNIALGPGGITLDVQQPAAATPEQVTIGFAGANPNATLQGQDLLPSRSNYFRGGASPINLSDIPQYASVNEQIAPGVSVVFHGNGPNLQYDIDLAPGADPSAVALTYGGAQAVSVDTQGNVVLQLAGGTLLQQAPVLYQTVNGSRQLVPGRYVEKGNGTIGFQVDGPYDKGAPLVLDPTLTFSTYLSGSNVSGSIAGLGEAVAFDTQGNSYIVGYTNASNFPTTPGVVQPVAGTNESAFISKFSPIGGLVWSTYLGGVGFGSGQAALGIAVDVEGNAFVTGWTQYSNFPTTSGAYKTSYPGSPSAFVTELSPAGDALVYSTFLGLGTADAIAVNTLGQAVVAGSTTSSSFPTLNAYQGTFGGGTQDVFVTELNSAGSGLVFSTYVGGSASDQAQGVAIAPNEQIYVSGWTQSSTFPTSTGAYQTTLAGTKNAFVTALTAAGGLVYSTLVGGSSSDQANAIAVNANGNAYLAGSTTSTNFPTTTGAYQTSRTGTQNTFVTELNPTGTGLVYSTYAGGSATDAANGIALDATGDAYLTGGTTSSNFPTTTGAYQSSLAGTQNAFVTEVNPAGTALVYSTFLGGSSSDQGNGIALDADGSVVLTGQTTSTNFPTAHAYQGSFGGHTGNTDAFVTKFGQLLPPLFTSISTDTGSSSSDQITSSQNLTLYGTAVANATITLYRPGMGQIGTTTASSAGLFTFSYTGTTLAEGTYGFTATAAAGGQTSAESVPFLVAVDTTAPAVTLLAPSSTVDPNPQLVVIATDLVGLPSPATVTLDVDLNDDGSFTGAELGYATATMSNGVAVFNLSPALAPGTYPMRARVSDLAGNQGTSAVVTMTLSATGSSWTITDTTPQIDPFTGDASLQRGNLTVSQALELDQSPGTSVGGDPALVYNSERVNVEPIIQAEIQSDNSVALPTTITTQLTINGTPQSPQNFSTSGLTAGDLITVAQQVSSPLTTTGRDTYTLTVTMNYATPIVRSVSGAFYVDREDASPFGAGWTFGSTDRLVSIAASGSYPAGLLRVYGQGGVAFYASNGSGGYTSPVGDAGTLSAVGSNYQYVSPDGRTWNFNSSGLETSFVSPDGLATIAYSYTGSNLTGISTPDGALTTLAYSTTQDTIKTGTRTVTLTLNSGTNNLTGLTNPDGGLRTVTYDGNHHLLQDQFGVLSTTYAYINGQEMGFTPGDGGAYTISPADLKGLSALAVTPFFASETDPLGRVTRAQLDASGRPLEVIAADGGLTSYARNSQGWVTQQTDPLGRMTTYMLDSAGYATMVYLPDGNTQKYQYQTAFHALTQYTDENGNLWTYTYDSGGHQLTQKDPLNEVTSYAYLTNGLLQSVEDPLGRYTTYGYDTSRRPSTLTDALGNVATTTYDTNGNVATQVDQLGRTTTFVNDALGRVLTMTDPTGASATYAYAGSGQLLSSTDALSHVTSHVYDTRGLETSLIEAVGSPVQRSTLWGYDAASQLTSTRDADGNSTTYAYDPVGRAASQTDPLGDVTGGSYDLAGQLLQQRNALGEATNYGYNSRGWVVKTTDALGNVATTVYDGVGNVTASIDPLGNTTSYSYDVLNRLVATIEAVGTSLQRTTTTVYDGAGNVYQTVDALGRITEYDRDALNRVTTMIEAKGTADQRTTTYAYDKVGNQTSTTDPRGLVTNRTFDALDRVTVLTEAAGTSDQRVTTTVFDAVSNTTSVTNALGQVTSYGYDALNRQVTEIDAYGTSLARTLTTTYDSLDNAGTAVDALGHANQSATDQSGRPTFAINALGQAARSYPGATGNADFVTDPLGNRTEKTFDLDGRPIQVKDALGNLATTVYDADHNVLATVDANGNRTTYGYDALNRRVTVTDALNEVSTVVYDAADNVLATVDALGNRTTYGYDNLNRRVTTTDALNHVGTTVYDGDDNASVQIDANGNRTTYGYDNLNRQVTVTDALNHTATTVYDKLDNVTAQVDANGNRTTYGYDGLNRRVTVTDALNEVSTVVYDAADNVLATVDALGHRTSYGYDAANRQITVTDALNHTATTVYDAANNVIATVDALGRTTTTSFDALNRPIQVQDALGNLTTVVLDAVGNRIATVDPLGNRTTTAFDALNRPYQTTNALGGLATVLYDKVGNEITQIDELGRRTTTAYDALNRPYQTANALGGLATTVYDNVGNVLATVDENGNRSTYSYDALNRQVTVKDALGNVATTVYDAVDNVLSETNARGYTTSYGYDALNRRVTTTDALNEVTTVVFDAAGNHLATVDARGNRTTYGYDVLNRQVSVTDALNHTSTTVYDAVDNPVQSIDALGYITTATFDTLNRRVAVQDPGGGINTTVYDAVGNKVNTIDPVGDKTTYAYDKLNRLVTTTDPLGYTTTLVLDAVGNQTTLIDADGNRTTSVYDALNRETERDLPTGGKITMAYDAGSRLTSQTDALGRRQDYAYDGDNQLLTDTWRNSSGTVVNLQTHTYDAVGNELTALDQNGAYTYSYDALDRVSTEQEPFGLTLTYGYDAVGNNTSLQDSKGGLTTSVYDAVNRLTTREFATGGANPLRFDQTFTARDQLASVTRYSDLSGTTKVGYATYVYDAVGRTSSIQEQDGSGNVLASYSYAYDLASRVTTQVFDGVTTTIAYNAASEVTNDSTTAYSYDGTGNRTMTGYGVGTNNQLTTDPSGYSYTYDIQGNEIKKSLGASADTWTFGWDNQNHLTSIQDRSTDGGTLVLSLTEKYDVYGRRIEEDRWTSTTGTVVTRFGYGPDNNVFADLDGSNNLQMRYVRPDGVDALEARQSATGTVVYYATDDQGTVRDLLSTSGTVIDHLTYSSYGLVLSESSPSNGDRFKYTGADYQADAQFTYNLHRWYDTRTGRWLTTDPKGFAAGDPDLYRYGENDPTNETDPSGLGGVIGGAISSDYGAAVRGGIELVTGVGSDPTRPQIPEVDWVALARHNARQNAASRTWFRSRVLGWMRSQPVRSASSTLRGWIRSEAVQNVSNTVSKEVVKPLGDVGEGFIGVPIELGAMAWDTGRTVVQWGSLYTNDWWDTGVYQYELTSNTFRGNEQAARQGQGDAFWLRNFRSNITVGTYDLGDAVIQGDWQKARKILGGQLWLAFPFLGRGGKRSGSAEWAPEGVPEAPAVPEAPGVPRGPAPAEAPRPGGVPEAPTGARAGVAPSRVVANVGKGGCFVGGTPFLTPEGEKLVEQFRPGDRILSRPENDVSAPLEVQVVEEVFILVAVVHSLQVGGRLIRVTGEHPFWVKGKGWVGAAFLGVGDLLSSHDGQWVPVEAVNTEDREVTTVYNLRVADYHTYFVGSREWGFSVWAHNICAEQVRLALEAEGIKIPAGDPRLQAIADHLNAGTSAGRNAARQAMQAEGLSGKNAAGVIDVLENPLTGTPPPAPATRQPAAPTPVLEEFNTFADAAGVIGELTEIEVLATNNPGIAAQGFTQKWIGKGPDGKWYSANYNPTRGTFSFGKESSRNNP